MSSLSVSSVPAGTPPSVWIDVMQDADDADVDALHAAAFGPGRFARTAFRLRERAAPVMACSFVARIDRALVGAVSMSRLVIGGKETGSRGLLLGPLAVSPDHRDVGVGRALLGQAVQAAFASGEPYVLLVGDLPYYAPTGFQRVPPGTMVMPGPVDPMRLLVAISPSLEGDAPTGRVEGAA
ncbi:MAG: N-acetyltransferase [Pseudomonadota bacterium]